MGADDAAGVRRVEPDRLLDRRAVGGRAGVLVAQAGVGPRAVAGHLARRIRRRANLARNLVRATALGLARARAVAAVAALSPRPCDAAAGGSARRLAGCAAARARVRAESRACVAERDAPADRRDSPARPPFPGGD